MYILVCSKYLSLVKTLQAIENQITDTVRNRYVLYDVTNAIKCIIEYMKKYQVCDAQQKKVKSSAFNNLDESSALWLQDFAPKVLPVRFQESQHEYFNKKEMNLHIDVFLSKTNQKLKSKCT